MRQSLPAVFGRTGDEAPAAFDVFQVGVLETLGRGDDVAGNFRAFHVAATIQRCQHFFGKFSGFLKNCANQVRRDFFAARQSGDFFQADDMFKQEVDVLQRGIVFRHAVLHFPAALRAREYFMR